MDEKITNSDNCTEAPNENFALQMEIHDPTCRETYEIINNEHNVVKENILNEKFKLEKIDDKTYGPLSTQEFSENVTEPMLISTNKNLDIDSNEVITYTNSTNYLNQQVNISINPLQLSQALNEEVSGISREFESIDDIATDKNEYNTDIEICENYFRDTIIELSRLPAANSSQNYFRGCKWSPDGTCILSVINNQGMQVSELPRDLYNNASISSDRPVDILNPAIHIKECGCVYDFCWYPKMNSFDPTTCCWASSTQHGPVQLWDAFDGSLRCSYRGYNDVDEVEAALTVCFSSLGDQIYAGYKKSIKLFNTDRPGRDCMNFRVKYPATCMTLNPLGNMLAVGSWRKTITLMSSESGELCELNILSGHKGGITHLAFAHDGNVLISGARKDPLIQCWDIRYCNKPIQTLCRIADSNQRMYFDVSPFGTWLTSANTNGVIRVWDMRTLQEENVKELSFPVHNDCCNGLSFHPSRPIIATSSGQHHFIMQDEDDEQLPTIKESSLALWWVGDMTITEDINM